MSKPACWTCCVLFAQMSLQKQVPFELHPGHPWVWFHSGEPTYSFLVGVTVISVKYNSYVIATSDLWLFILASNLLPSLSIPLPFIYISYVLWLFDLPHTGFQARSRGGRWSWTLKLAQKRSWAGRWSWAVKVGLLSLRVAPQQQCNGHCPCDSAQHCSWNSNSPTARCTSRCEMAWGHRFNNNTSIVLAAVHGLSGLFRVVCVVKPSLSRLLPPLSPSLISNLASVDVKQPGHVWLKLFILYTFSIFRTGTDKQQSWQPRPPRIRGTQPTTMVTRRWAACRRWARWGWAWSATARSLPSAATRWGRAPCCTAVAAVCTRPTPCRECPTSSQWWPSRPTPTDVPRTTGPLPSAPSSSTPSSASSPSCWLVGCFCCWCVSQLTTLASTLWYSYSGFVIIMQHKFFFAFKFVMVMT